METLEKSIAHSLDGNDEALYAYLPYLLQDLWEIGSEPKAIIRLIEKHGLVQPTNFNILDLGCGKGAISIQLAQKFGIRVHGIDGMPAFIDEAWQWAKKLNVTELCQFEVADIRQRVQVLKNYDLAFLGSIGPVFGDVEKTLQQVKSCIKASGYIILDDGYVLDENQANAPHYLTKTEVLSQIKNAGMRIVDEYHFEHGEMVESDTFIFDKIKQRADELKQKFPNRAALFDAYVQAQAEENDVLENQVECVTWLLHEESDK